MARSFNGSSDYLTVASAVVTATPLTLSVWHSPSSYTAGAVAMMHVGNNGSNGDYWRITWAQSMGFDAFPAATTAQSNGVSSSSSITISGGVTLDTWHHAAGIFSSDANRVFYHDGSPASPQTTSRAVSGVNSASVGRTSTATPSQYYPGRLAEPAIWNVALTAAEIAMLAAGVCPLLIRPGNLVAYWPLFGAGSSEPDRSLFGNRYSLAVTGATQAEDPAIVRQYRFADMLRLLTQQRSFGVTAAPGDPGKFNAAWAMNSNKLIGCGIY